MQWTTRTGETTDEGDRMSDLKPCPFCGGEAKMVSWRLQGADHMQCGYVHCTKCNAKGDDWNDIRTATRHETIREENGIKAWNTRTLNIKTKCSY